MLAVFCGLLWLSLLHWIYIVMWHKCQNYVCCILQSNTVVITVLDEYCSMLWSSLLCWMYIAQCCGGDYNVGYILQCAVLFITILDVYCNCNIHPT